jgi:cellulose synthase/poly-beta-1,6-N-acetylglucosamine synthase-like glycosyltransferase
MMIWAFLLIGVTLIWASRHLEINRARRDEIPLRADQYPSPAGDSLPRISVIIAAKDEEDNIERAVRSMLKQDYPNFELIVVNDRSEDRTAEILEDIQTETADGRLQIVHVTDLEEGWFGKNNAMREGMARASGEWLCFSDADCHQESDRAISVAMQHALETETDFLSVLPRLETQSLWEQIVQPVCGGIMVFWFHPRRVNNPDHRAAYANGAFMLMTRNCYDTIGGHHEVRTEVNEDIHMARLAKERGQRLRVAQNEDLYTVRMYSNFGQIWRGWSRIFYGCFGTFRRLAISLTTLTLTNTFPYASLLIGMVVLLSTGLSSAGSAWTWVTVAALAAVVMQQTVIVRYYRLSKANPWWAPTFIVGALLVSGMLINAMTKLGGKTSTTWRGTTYRGKQLAQQDAS